MDNARAFALGQLDRVMGFYPRVESKASFLFAIDLAMIGSIGVAFPVHSALSPRGFAAISATLLLVISLWHLYRAFHPHLKGTAQRSLVYFGDIAAGSADEYRAQLGSTSDETLLEDLSCQIWRNSEILSIKFAKVEVAFILTAISVLPWFVFLIAIAIRLGRFVVGG
jgi:hypothetical protein